MANRILRKENVTSEKLNAVSVESALQWHHMVTRCDDFGLIDLSPASLKMNCWPGRSFTVEQIDAFTKELLHVGLVREYSVLGKRLGALTNWDQPRWAKFAKYPRPPWGWEHITGGYVAPRARTEDAEPAPARMNGSGWWKTNQGIDAKGLELGLPARPGEDYYTYKNRLFKAIADAKQQT